MTATAVLSEPLTYQPHAPTSYFRDLALAENRDNAAVARLKTHAREMRVELPRREARARAQTQLQAAKYGLEYRTSPTRTPGQGGYAAPPLWLIDYFAMQPRPGRVLADLAPGFELPPGVGSVSLPRMLVGNTVAVQADGTSVPSTDMTDAAVTSSVVSLSGQADVALSMLEQSPPGAHLDWVIFHDLANAYDAQLEVQLINGAGGPTQLLGLLNVVGTNVITNSGAATGSALVPLLGQAAAQIGNKRLQPPRAWLMTTSRWAWLGTSEDAQGLPLMLGAHDGEEYEGHMLGWPVHADDAIPTTLGATANQDAIIACRPSDMLVLEGAPHTVVLLEVLSGTLQARIQMHAYVAAFTGRYPTGISKIQGVGMVIQPGFA